MNNWDRKIFERSFKKTPYLVGEIYFDWIPLLASELKIEKMREFKAFVFFYEYFREKCFLDTGFLKRIYDSEQKTESALIVRELLVGLYPEKFELGSVYSDGVFEPVFKCSDRIDVFEPLFRVENERILRAFSLIKNKVLKKYYSFELQYDLDIENHCPDTSSLLKINELIARLGNRDSDLFEEISENLEFDAKNEYWNEKIDYILRAEPEPTEFIALEEWNAKMKRELKKLKCDIYKKYGFEECSNLEDHFICDEEIIHNYIIEEILGLIKSELQAVPKSNNTSYAFVKNVIGSSEGNFTRACADLFKFQKSITENQLLQKPVALDSRGGEFSFDSFLKELGIFRVIRHLLNFKNGRIEGDTQKKLSGIERDAWRLTSGYHPRKGSKSAFTLYESEDSVLFNKRIRSKHRRLPVLMAVWIRGKELLDDYKFEDEKDVFDRILSQNRSPQNTMIDEYVCFLKW